MRAACDRVALVSRAIRSYRARTHWHGAKAYAQLDRLVSSLGATVAAPARLFAACGAGHVSSS